MKKKWIWSTTLIGMILTGIIIIGPVMSDVETPSYRVVESQEDIEIRHYDPMIVANVKIAGDRDNSLRKGFQLLADYIFGNNTIVQDIAMTAPVQQQIYKKISMTAPVQQQAMDTSWEVSFVMPSEYNMVTLPRPNNESIVLEEIPAEKFAVIIFSGTSSSENIEKYEKRLMRYLARNNIEAVGTPKYAFYNPPWTLPQMRRNEVMMKMLSR